MALLRHQSGGTVRRAVAAAELACVIPLFGMIILGMFELSRGMIAKETLSNAARKGCRTGIQRDKASMDIYNDAVNIMRDNGYDSSKFNPQAPDGSAAAPYIGSITITVTDPNGITLSDTLNAPAGSEISVQVSIPGSSVTWVTSYFLQDTMIESETVIMMKQ
jgi:Flp pilus assembly protein TadG